MDSANQRIHLALQIMPNGETNQLQWIGTKSYEVIKNGIGGGYIEGVHMPRINGRMWVDEDFLYKSGELQVNAYATYLAIALGYPFEYFISGPCVLTGESDQEGNTLGLSQGQIETIFKLLGEIRANSK